MSMWQKDREIWIDDVKVIACILVLLGHLMQSMTSSNIIPDGELYQWFNKTIYYFHVPLFFICSGYLYQRYSCVNSLNSWSSNIRKKLLTLGIPYFAFTIITWLMKMLIPGAGNNTIDNIFVTLFLHPTAPYWYLYALFFVFLITPTFRTKKNASIGLIVALWMKITLITGIVPNLFEEIYAISTILSNEIWFVIGMLLCVFEVPQIWFKNHWPEKEQWIDICLSVTFLTLSVLFRNTENDFLSFLLGVIACSAIVLICMGRTWQGRVMAFLSKYTMPVFLMHSIFAATLRSALLKVGINNAVIHIVGGIAISILGPIIAAWIMKKTRYLEFFIYPEKFINNKLVKELEGTWQKGN